MEIAIAIFFLAVIGVTVALFGGLILYMIWCRIRRAKNNQQKNFVADSDDSDYSGNYHSGSNYQSNSSVIIPTAAVAVAGGNEIINNSQETGNETAGASWDYNDYGSADSGGSDSSSDSSSSCSSGSSCSSCGGD